MLFVYAPWCPHCHSVKDSWKGLASKMSKKYNILAMNADENTDTCRSMGIESFPSFFNISRSGKLEKTEVENRSQENLEKILEKYSKSQKKTRARSGPQRKTRRRKSERKNKITPPRKRRVNKEKKSKRTKRSKIVKK